MLPGSLHVASAGGWITRRSSRFFDVDEVPDLGGRFSRADYYWLGPRRRQLAPASATSNLHVRIHVPSSRCSRIGEKKNIHVSNARYMVRSCRYSH